MQMEFKTFFKILFQYCNDGRSIEMFMRDLFDFLIADPKTDNDKKRVYNENYNPLNNLSPNTIRAYADGKRMIAKSNAKFMLSHLDRQGFINYINSFLKQLSDDSLHNLINQITKEYKKNNIGAITADNIGEVCASIFIEILNEIANSTPKRKDSSKTLSEDSTEHSALISQTGISTNINTSVKEVIAEPDKRFFSQEMERAKNGCPDAMLEIGSFYYYGIMVKKDASIAAYWLKKLANLQSDYSPIAKKFIARMYYEGSMPMEEQSYEKCYKYNLQAAESDLFSAGQVGAMQAVGCGCQFDYERTEKYFLSIFDNLDNSRKDKLCRFYITYGQYQKAAEIYKTMEDTYPYAAYQLGLFNKTGVLNHPFMPDYFLAEKYFLKAYEAGYTQATYELGLLYFNPTGGFRKDFNKALKYFLIAANDGNFEAHYRIGYMYLHGHVKKDRQKAIEHFEIAANQGHIYSASNLALLYLDPENPDYDKAFYYCSFAANCGDAPAQYFLGTMYLFGMGCEPDKNKAYYYLNKAALSNAPEANVLLKQLANDEI